VVVHYFAEVHLLRVLLKLQTLNVITKTLNVLLIKSIFSITVPQSILLELQWLFPEIICSKQLLWLQPCQYHWSCGICSGICRCWDWRGTGMAMLENMALRSCSNEGTDSAEVGGWLWMCAHTLPTSCALQILWWNLNCLCNSSFTKEGGQAQIATWGFHMAASNDWLLMITMLSNLLAQLQDES